MKKLKFAAIAALGLLGAAATSGNSSAMPMPGLAPAFVNGEGSVGQLEKAAWVCGPYRCHHVYGGPKPYYSYAPGWRRYHHHPRFAYGLRRW